MRTRRISCTVAALAALAVACGGPAGPSEEAVAWTNRVCDALSGFTRAATTGPQIDPADPVAAVQELDRYLAATSEELQRSLTALGAVGGSPVDGGDAYVARLEEALRGIRSGFDTAREQLAAVDVSNAEQLATAVPGAMAPLQELRNLPSPTEGLRDTEELGAASEQAEQCRALRSSAAQGG
ncbi:MAG TPA: hypothetical protein VKZ81_28785 [Pseudonocardia sp.]|jgi:hypothetical protein|uniref:hypothetical protein n=1 Tax=Pseudonocardia sp. TaxID=60912 RepID=UPI002B4B3B51|nr:hypothetical protein [Pseudonocardia sp.]HLU59476.1 hypothetical protein [Pseudonocardia sp.]